MENLQEKYATDPTVMLFKNYTTCIKARDAARKMAEDAEKERKAAWRVFYKYSEELDELEKRMDSEVGIPPAPKKRGRVIDLTQ
jgi:hypothetical protein